MFKLDTLVDIAACFEHAKAVRPQNLEHWITMAEIICVPGEVRVVYRLRRRHHNSLKIKAGEEGLGQRVAQVPGHLQQQSAHTAVGTAQEAHPPRDIEAGQ